jgi:hypothetical protein
MLASLHRFCELALTIAEFLDQGWSPSQSLQGTYFGKLFCIGGETLRQSNVDSQLLNLDSEYKGDTVRGGDNY